MRALMVSLVTLLIASTAAADPVGRMIYATGRAQLMRNLKPQKLIPGISLEENDTLRVQIGARMKSILADDSILMIWEDTEIRLETAAINFIQGTRVVEIEQLTGNLRVIGSEFLGSESVIRVRTPNARIELKGAGDMIIRQGVQGDNTEIVAVEGAPKIEHIFTEYGGEPVVLEPQQTTVVGAERAPSTPVFMDRDAFDGMVAEQLWTIPQPVPDWRKFFNGRLEDYATSTFGRVRRLAAKPFTPIHTVVEGMAEQNVPDRPGALRPEPTGRLTISIDCSSCAEGELGGAN